MNSLKLHQLNILLGHDMEITLDISLFFIKLITLMRFSVHLNMSNVQ